MCRHLAYIGEPITIGSLLFDAPHSLSCQARDPRFIDLPSADGYGVSWYEKGETRLARTIRPIWEDAETPLSEVSASSFVAAARMATPGGVVEEASTAPLVDGRYSFALNGFVADYRLGNSERLLQLLTKKGLQRVQGDVDTGVLFALVLDQLDMQVSLREALANVHFITRRFSDAPMNMVISDGVRIAATASIHSLFVRRSRSGTTIASEALDDNPLWQRLPDDSLVEASLQSIDVVALGSVFVEESSPCSLPARSMIGSE